MYDKFELYIMTIYSYIEKAVPYLVTAAVLNVFFSNPVKTFLNWTIPEFVNINVGSLLGTKLLESTI